MCLFYLFYTLFGGHNNEIKIKKVNTKKTDRSDDKKKSLITNQKIFVHWKIFLTKIYNESNFYEYSN